MYKRSWVYVVTVLSMFFWGLSFVWFKIAVKYYGPISIIFIRLILSSTIILTTLKLTGTFQKIHPKDLKYFFLLALTQPFFYFLGESFGLRLVSSTFSAVIISTIPLFTPIAAYLFLREKVNSSVIIGLIFSFIGILVMLINQDGTFNASPQGILLLFFAVFSAVGSSIFIRKIAHSYNAMMITGFQNLIGIFYFLPLFLVFDYHHFIEVKPTRELVSAILELAIFSSSFAYIFFNIAIKELGVVKAGIFSNLIPVFTGVFSYFILDESFTMLKIIGVAIVLTGLVISQYHDFKKKKKSLVDQKE